GCAAYSPSARLSPEALLAQPCEQLPVSACRWSPQQGTHTQEGCSLITHLTSPKLCR
ncbi:unnamed protein product, partial [Rangifer tarandus platyrhynchus]